MNEQNEEKSLVKTVVWLIVIVSVMLMAVAFYERTHPEFDEKISGKEATVVSEVAKIYYDVPFGRDTGTVTKSQKVELTGKMGYQMQSDIVMMEICLEDNRSAWISKKDITISE